MVARLREIVDAEQIAISDQALGLVARRGEGSMRDSLSTLDQVIAFCGEQVSDEEVLGLLGMVDRRLLLDTVEGVLQRDSHRALEAVRRVDNLGYSFRQFCQELVEAFRAVVLCKVMPEPGELLDVVGDELRELKALADAGSLEDHQRALTLLLRAETELAGSSFPRLTIEMALVRLTQLPPAKDVAALVRKIEGLEKRLAGAGGLPAGPAPAAPVSPPPARPAAAEQIPEPAGRTEPPKAPEIRAPGAAGGPGSDGGSGWQGLVEQIRRRRPMIGSILEHGSLLALELPSLHLGFSEGSFHLEQMKDPENLEVLKEMAEAYFGQAVAIKISAADIKNGEAPRSLIEERKAQETDRKKRLREDALAHPLVQKAVEVFEGEVKEVKAIDKGFV